MSVHTGSAAKPVSTAVAAAASRAVSAVGLLALAFASVAGAGFVSTGDNSASMAMSALTGVALLCYAVNLYVLSPAARRE
jgi:hypothetical protein